MRVTSQHWELFLTFAEENRQLITNKFNGVQGKAEGNALWQTVSSQLNSLGLGQKTVAEWRKATTDWKSKVKAKAAKIRLEQNRTGGGVYDAPPLTALEEKLLAIMGIKCIEGDSVQEYGFETDKNLPSSTLSMTATPSTSRGLSTEPTGDHDYIRVNETPTKRRRISTTAGLTKQLIALNEEHLDTLKSINKNLKDISESLEELVNIYKQKV